MPHPVSDGSWKCSYTLCATELWQTSICCSARRGGTTTTLDQLVKYPEFFHMPLVNGSYWAMVHGSNPAQVLQDEEGCAVMRELGRNMAWLLQCIEAGKAAGIRHPENPRRPMTNFIR
jgi:multimeric flavodoxin WrbA